MKQAVILAAGRGSRLEAASGGRPKCLVPVAGVPLIERQLRVLRELGISRICVVVGHQCEEVRSVVGPGCDFVVNPRFAETNSLYSLWLAREWLAGSFVLMNCDVLAHPDIYHRVLAVNGTALAYDSSSGEDDEHMKVTLKGRFVHALSKQLPHDEVHGENVGIIHFSERALPLLMEEAGALVRAGDEQTWAPAAVDRLAKRMAVRGIDVRDLPWTEIDFPVDLEHAENRTWPLITTGRWTTGPFIPGVERIDGQTNGQTNGQPNGQANGYANGQARGEHHPGANGTQNGHGPLGAG